MNYLEVKKEVKKEFDSFLKPLGYKSKTDPQGCQFTLDSDVQQVRFSYGISNYGDEFDTGFSLRLGIKAIQVIQNKIFEEQNYYDTIVTGSAHYFNEINYRYKIRSEEDVRAWGNIIKKFYKDYAIPFIEKFNSIEAIDKLLNEYLSEKVIYLDDLPWRVITGLIAAKLNRNHRYEELRNHYKNETETKFQGYFMYPKCMKVIDFLDNYSSDELNKMAVRI